MCIYLPDQPGLTYFTEEHIFPAAIGGIATLQKGFVSDQFNNRISKTEQDFIRDGLISIRRPIEGPGRRGSHSESKASKSKITVTRSTDDPGIGLGYLKLGRAYEIPHVKLELLTGVFDFSYDKTEAGDHQAIINRFVNHSESCEFAKIRVFTSEHVPPDVVLFGLADGIEENFTGFLAHHPSTSYPLTKEKISLFGLSVAAITNSQARSVKYFPQMNFNFHFKPAHLRVYGKVAFNLLCYILGREVVLQPGFDAVRNWIVKGGEYGQVSFLKEGIDPFVDLNSKMPDSSHFVLLYQNGMVLSAVVSFYSGMAVEFVLSDQFIGKINIDGLICDWRNKCEYRLINYIASHVAQRDDRKLS